MEQEEDVETMQEVGVEEDVSEKREELIFEEEEEEEVGVEEDVNEKCEELIMEEEEEVEVEVEVEDDICKESEEVIEKREAMKVEEDGMKEEVKDDKNENDITEEDWQGLFRRIEDLAAECILDKSDHLNFCLMLISLSSFSKKSPTGPTERTPKSEYLNKSN